MEIKTACFSVVTLRESQLNREDVTTLLTASPQNVAAVLGQHALSEAVRSFSLQIRLRSQCFFHGNAEL
jgi:hypothetical protein